MDNPPPVSIAYSALRGRCPACGKGKLFRNLLDVADYCPHCGQSFQGMIQGDGPASLSILVVGALTGIGAVVMDIKFAPPYWVHAVVWIPFVIIGSLMSLRGIKAAFVAMQFRYRKDELK